MKRILLLLVLYFYNPFFNNAQSSWKDSGLKPQQYSRLLVIAKMKDPVGQRLLEDATVLRLSEKGIRAVAQYSVISGADSLSDEAFNQITDSLRIDGMLVYALEAPGKIYKERSSLNLGIEIPFRLGIFGGFLGTNFPLAGGTRVISVVNGNVSFYNRNSKSMVWSTSFSRRNEGWEDLSIHIARITVRALFRDEIFMR